MNTDFDFEGQWQHKLGEAVAQRVSDPAREFVLEAGSALNDKNSALEKLVWTCGMLERLEGESDLITRQEILADCHCSYPLEDLLDIKMTYRISGDIDQVLFMLQAKFESFLRKNLTLEEELVEFIVKNDWGLAGYRDGNRIIATKIPKSGYLREYFKEDDPEKKRKLYCHCPRVRDEVGSEPGLPMEYCYCGAGFYKGIWEEILGEPVEVEMIDSVMQGDDVCTVAVHLPDKT
jgi:hypothetical protein